MSTRRKKLKTARPVIGADDLDERTRAARDAGDNPASRAWLAELGELHSRGATSSARRRKRAAQRSLRDRFNNALREAGVAEYFDYDGYDETHVRVRYWVNGRAQVGRIGGGAALDAKHLARVLEPLLGQIHEASAEALRRSGAKNYEALNTMSGLLMSDAGEARGRVAKSVRRIFNKHEEHLERFIRTTYDAPTPEDVRETIRVLVERGASLRYVSCPHRMSALLMRIPREDGEGFVEVDVESGLTIAEWSNVRRLP